jgi:hypothetical protein
MRFCVALIGVTSALALAIACDGSDPQQEPCKDIPAGGCPLSNGVACQDPSCVAAYACNADGTWTLDHACPGADAATTDAPTETAAPEMRFDASFIDAPAGANGGPGCTGLEQPDCALGDVLACPSGCCNCEDLYVCANGGWNHWGTCDAMGIHEDK